MKHKKPKPNKLIKTVGLIPSSEVILKGENGYYKSLFVLFIATFQSGRFKKNLIYESNYSIYSVSEGKIKNVTSETFMYTDKIKLMEELITFLKYFRIDNQEYDCIVIEENPLSDAGPLIQSWLMDQMNKRIENQM